jgi:hypothetical protein
MLNWKRRLALLAVPAVLAIGGGSVIAHAASTPSAAPPAAAAEQPETATEQAEANEPAEPGGGHTDAGDQTDHQFNGVE